jgi:DHA1 family inner membrane transport protein
MKEQSTKKNDKDDEDISSALLPIQKQDETLVEISAKRRYAAVLALTTGTLALGINEFVPLGFIPDISKTYSIPVQETAWITSAFMIGAAVSSPVLTIIGSKINKKYFLVSLQSLLVGAATTSVLAPNFGTLLTGRVLSACSHAAYMGVGSVVTASLFPESKKGFAISIFFTGLTIANLAGVPLDTLLGQKFGWRYTFWPVMGLALASLLGTMSFLPKIHSNGQKPDFQKELAVFKKSGVWLALSVSTFGYAGMLASHTYFTEMMTQLAGFTNDDITWLTIVYGAAAVLGNIFGGKMADKHVFYSMISLLALLAVVLFTFTYSVYYQIPAVISLFANGFVGFSLISPLMKYTISKASDAPALASACNISAFGVGIALGVFLSGIAINNFGYASPNWVGGSLTAFGLLIALVSEGLSKLCGPNNNSGITEVRQIQSEEVIIAHTHEQQHEHGSGGIYRQYNNANLNNTNSQDDVNNPTSSLQRHIEEDQKFSTSQLKVAKGFK